MTEVISRIAGMHDVKLLRDFGQPNLDLRIDRRQAARFGINVADIQDAVQTAVASGQVDTMKNIKANQLVYVKEGEGIVRTVEFGGASGKSPK